MTLALLAARKIVRAARADGAAVLPEPIQALIFAAYDAILAEGLALHKAQPAMAGLPGAGGRSPRRPGHNLLIGLRDFKGDVLRFVTDFTVPFTNNQAEQDLRMMKVRMSGGFRTPPPPRSLPKSAPSSPAPESTVSISYTPSQPRQTTSSRSSPDRGPGELRIKRLCEPI